MTSSSVQPNTWKFAHSRVPLFGFEVDAITMSDAVDRVYHWIRSPRRGASSSRPMSIMPVLFQRDADLRASYANAALVLADGTPVVLAARLLGRPLPGRVAGSDLVPALFEAAADRAGLRVFLLGAAPGVAERAAENIRARWLGVEIVGTYSPPIGFENDERESQTILGKIAAVLPDVLIVGLGAPKQERWVNLHRDRIEAAVTLCVGATIDFLAGERRRAPRWMRRGGLEWLHRVASEPKRLLKRYVRDAWIFPQLVCGEWIASRRQSAGKPARQG